LQSKCNASIMRLRILIFGTVNGVTAIAVLGGRTDEMLMPDRNRSRRRE